MRCLRYFVLFLTLTSISSAPLFAAVGSITGANVALLT